MFNFHMRGFLHISSGPWLYSHILSGIPFQLVGFIAFLKQKCQKNVDFFFSSLANQILWKEICQYLRIWSKPPLPTFCMLKEGSRPKPLLLHNISMFTYILFYPYITTSFILLFLMSPNSNFLRFSYSRKQISYLLQRLGEGVVDGFTSIVGSVARNKMLFTHNFHQAF